MDFTKLISLFERNELFFSRADYFDDKYEGTLPGLSNNGIQEILRRFPKEHRADVEEHIKETRKASSVIRRLVNINCWHINEYESAAMWKLYLKSNEGIAIQSTYRSLSESIKVSDDDDDEVVIGIVQYMDYEKEWNSSPGDYYNTFLRKRRSFSCEQELRAIRVNFQANVSSRGLYVPVDLKRLIQRIYVAPSSPEWFYELVKSVTKKYEYNFDVVRSELDDSIIY